MIKKIRQCTKISIIIPTYDRAALLKRCLESIFSSSYENIEVIVVDNNTSDETENMVKNSFPEVKIYRKGFNNGASWARNFGADKATGNWILFVDDDNTVDKKMITNLIVEVEKNPYIAAVSPFTYYFNSKDIWFCGANFNFYTSKPLFFNKPLNEFSFYECQSIHNIFLINKKLGDGLGWFDQSMVMMYEEFDLFCKIRAAGYKIGVVPLALAWHNVSREDQYFRVVNTKIKAFCTIKNRALIVKRYANFRQKVFFSIISYPFFIIVYLLVIIGKRKFSYILPHLRGAFRGYRYLLGV